MDTPYPTERVPSDDCAVIFQKQLFYPHKGQWVEVVRVGQSLQEMKLEMEARGLTTQLNVLRSDLQDARAVFEAAKERGDTTAAARAEAEWEHIYDKRNALMVGEFDSVAQYVADHIVDWDWIGRNGKPLPKPDGTIEPIQRLLPEEVYYLQGVVRQENPLASSGAENGSEIGSGDTPSAPTSPAPSRTKAPSLTK